jgi:hypothetical protein
MAENLALYESIVGNFTKLTEEWYQLIWNENKEREIRLAGNVLSRYFLEIAELKQRHTGSTLLPANFEIYAFCVQAMFEQLLAYKPTSSPGTIYISTLLTKPLIRWYNISTGPNEDGDLCTFTRTRWELYKSQVTQLKIDPDTTWPKHAIQMRRILVPNARPLVGTNQYILSLPGVEQFNFSDGRNIEIPPCMELDEQVKNTLRGKDIDRKCYIIAKHTNCTKEHKDWRKLREEHFEPEYHNGVHDGKWNIGMEEKGVYCGYAPANYPHGEYEDIFIVDMRSIDEGSFGIAYHKDYRSEAQGVVFLTDAEILKHLTDLQILWDIAGRS